jgi:putative glutamine amidotransferase
MLGANQSYARGLAHLGATPFLAPVLSDTRALRELYDRADGVLLPDGVDICPCRYGEAERHARTDAPDAERDEAELALARWALEDGKPLLGICRGMQVLNVAAGGTLCQDIEALRPLALKHDHYAADGTVERGYLAHQVALRPLSRLAGVFGHALLWTNSLHHRAVERVGPGLRAAAAAPDCTT